MLKSQLQQNPLFPSTAPIKRFEQHFSLKQILLDCNKNKIENEIELYELKEPYKDK